MMLFIAMSVIKLTPVDIHSRSVDGMAKSVCTTCISYYTMLSYIRVVENRRRAERRARITETSEM